MPHLKKLTLYLTLLLLGGGLLVPAVSLATLTLDSTTLTSDGALTVKSASSSITLIGETNQTGAITVASSSETLILNLGTGTGATTVNIATGATNAKTVNISTGANLLNVITLGAASTTLNIAASSTFSSSLALSGLATNSFVYLNASGVITGLASSTASKVLTATSTAPYFSWETGGTAIPAGSIMLYASSTAPTGWLLADGSAVSRTTYADLFAAIGTTYGTGDGATTFNLPDLQGRVPVGKGSNTSVDTLGENEGVAEANRRPQHNHTNGLTLPNHGHSHSLTLPNHTHSMYRGTPTGGGSDGASAQLSGPVAWSTGGAESSPAISGSVGNPTTNPAIDGTIGPSGTNPADAPAYIVLNYIIKT